LWASRVLAFAEDNTETSVYGEDVEAHRSHQAVACRKRYAVELGKPRYAPGENQVGRRKAAICRWGVLSGIVLSGRESRPHGEGPDGRTNTLQRKLVPDM
jgi:hypothetical protein